MRFTYKKALILVALMATATAQAQSTDKQDCWAMGNDSAWTALFAGLVKPFVCIPLDIANNTTQTANQTATTQTLITPSGTYQITQGSGPVIIAKTAKGR